jgi:competence protein ComEA
MDNIKIMLSVLLLTVSAFCFAEGPIDINSADKETLMMVAGVGEKRAEAIIHYRETYGPFATVDELTEVEGIGPSTIEANREILVVTEH